MPASKIVAYAQVRALLEERFPAAVAAPVRSWDTGWPELDGQDGAILLGAVSELCCSLACGRLFLDRVLAAVGRKNDLAALIEVGRTFDPQSYREADLQRVLSVFCPSVEVAIKAADLLLRDGNLPLILLDLQTLPLRNLGRIPANTWHRFQRLVEKSGTALVILTPQPIVEAARARITLRGTWDLSAMTRPRHELFEAIAVQIFRRGRPTMPLVAPLVKTA